MTMFKKLPNYILIFRTFADFPLKIGIFAARKIQCKKNDHVIHTPNGLYDARLLGAAAVRGVLARRSALDLDGRECPISRREVRVLSLACFEKIGAITVDNVRRK